MDFQSLSRRELQALCKINKIPANMTNLAMADALQSLQHVEGMEDFMRAAESEPQSPEKMNGDSDLQGVPRSVCRTSTRTRLAIESESAVTKARGRPTTKVSEDVPFTPTVASRARRAPVAASASKNTESVACSTRRSVRLAVKQLDALSLNQKEKTQPIKIDDMSYENIHNLDNELPDKILSDVDVKVVTKKSSVSIIVSSIVSEEEKSEVVKTTLNSKVDVQEDKVVELYDGDVKCDVDSDVKEIVVEHVASKDMLGGDLDTKALASCETTEESDIFTAEKMKCTLEQNLEEEKAPLEKNDCDDLTLGNSMADVEMSNDNANVEKEEQLVVKQPSDELPLDNVMTDFEMSNDDVNVGNEEVLVWEQPSVAVKSVVHPSDSMDVATLPEENEAKSNCFAESVEPELNVMNLSAAVGSMTESVVEEVEVVVATTEESSTMDTSSTSIMKMSPFPVISSNSELNGKIPYSNWAVDPVMGQIPRPTQTTPRKTSRMENLVEINKENVDRSGGNKMIHMIENKASTPLDKKSLRKLSKMVREKLQIQNKSKISDSQEDVVVQEKQLGKSRLALQALPENKNNQD